MSYYFVGSWENAIYKSHRSTHVFILLVLIAGLIVSSCSSGEYGPTPRPAEPPPERSTINYEVTGPQPYGSATLPGNLYRITVPDGTDTAEIEKAVTYEAYHLINNNVKLGTDSLKPIELIFFIYIGRNPGDGGNWIADEFTMEEKH